MYIIKVNVHIYMFACIPHVADDTGWTASERQPERLKLWSIRDPGDPVGNPEIPHHWLEGKNLQETNQHGHHVPFIH